MDNSIKEYNTKTISLFGTFYILKNGESMIKTIFSMKAAVLVMIVFATTIGYATFLENDYGTQSARALIYNARWFELLLFYFIAIMVYNIVNYKMYKRGKWGQFVLHSAFVFIAVGALITRYVGYEGVLHLREGQTSNKMLSDTAVLSVAIEKDGKSYLFDHKVLLSSLGTNRLHTKIDVDGKEIDIRLNKYLPAAKQELQKVKSGGSDYLEFMVAPAGARAHVVSLKKGDYRDFGSFVISFDSGKKFNKPVIEVTQNGKKLAFKSESEIATKSMDTLKNAQLQAGVHPLQKRTLYNLAGNSFVLKKIAPHSKLEYVSTALKSSSQLPDMLQLEVSSGNESKEVTLLGKKGSVGTDTIIDIDGMKLAFRYGSKVIELPFALKLKDFELKRYPGSMSPSSYSSRVKVVDEKAKKSFDYHIYMNHVLDYKGFRFFQSSYDPDERGTVLSVNHDPGTLLTYIGYIMLAIGFIWSFLSQKGRIKTLLRKLNKIKEKSTAVVAFAAFASLLSLPVHASTIDASNLTKAELAKIQNISNKHTEKFARLIVQSNDGRMEPMDTLDLDIVKKISSKRGFLGLDYNQIVLGMLIEPEIYSKLKIIKIGHPLLVKKLRLPKGSGYASFDNFFVDTKKGKRYILQEDLDAARHKRAAERSKYDNEILKVDEKLNVLYMTSQGYLLKLFPKPNDPNHTWYNPIDAMKAFPKKEGQVVRYIVSSYLKSVLEGVSSGNWKKADGALDIIKNYQNFYGSEVIPSKKRVEAEIFNNRIDIFTKLIFAYIVIGFVLLVATFASIVKPTINIKKITYVATALLVITLLIHTAGLLLRWYIADHAPWSNAYESVVYIAWATALAGFIFAKRSPLAFAATSILTGVFLFVAFISALNPQITNLVPVLKSYWLMIHVAIITSSYGFLGLGALLGLFALILMIVNKKQEKGHIVVAIKEITIINEITLLIGLALLSVGNFLGGVWANESWGRYWGWDPKETWAAATILFYAAVVHMRFIPKLNSIFAFNVAAVVAYFSVIMTYFGVNYYLSGMHSYAAGDPVPIPLWVYFAVASVFILIVAASRYRINAKL